LIRDWLRLLGFIPSQGEFVATHYPFKKAVNGFVAGFKAVLLFQAPRYFWPRAVTTAHGPDQVHVFLGGELRGEGGDKRDVKL
jgi:hypothetical protein